ncbi:MAG: DNA-directed RNA polymerase subunit P [Candidatus Nezhaarchaeota archaeon]|nr:DNA-directed RNA polymerase subunit P [Candidatus Nezhaarchaeota archaeon]MCX8141489.1 DNA-directed RNA polymerase subunit P [Candidatus Nezhaarchaeota archaeon]MDW8049755.1 DNA-directed RNA polymerase subunit P [Nitrososphaerota archaeon]
MVRYKCMRCGNVFSSEEMIRTLGIRCPYCDSRIMFKIPPPIARRIKA